ncbi:MAG: hypothetical protein JKY55_19970 [Aliivibrio sp.]|uniref:hypothetical protein n=1 Tax=Aliivibrio sp. TaxID=1872443 RepID=UPI001A3E5F7C|nr:hypothetical protein [Aliivibrio sp.]
MNLSNKTLKIFEDCERKSNDDIEIMRGISADLFGNNTEFIIGVNGSYARREVTSGSDIDLFFLAIGDDTEQIVSFKNQFTDKLKERGFKMPADGGVFEEIHTVNNTIDTIGGLDDKNEHITRRMLLLLEGEWLFNEEKFKNVREELINSYIDKSIRDDQICMFLLNDIIRYWRTICVDFEFKVKDGDKARAIRLIKLRFSRMMLYLAGLLAVGETYKKNREGKLNTLLELFEQPPIKRFQSISGKQGMSVLNIYAEFLTALDDEKIRMQLDIKGEPGMETTEYKSLHELAHNFRKIVYEFLGAHYKNGHPMLSALML